MSVWLSACQTSKSQCFNPETGPCAPSIVGGSYGTDEGKLKERGNRMIKTKDEMYKTARARISCALFQKGDFVSVKFSHVSGDEPWFEIDRSENGKLPYVICYPKKHLTDFCL